MNVVQTIESDEVLFINSSREIPPSEISEYIRRWGGSVSAPILDASSNTFSILGIDGVIGYRIESKCAVVFGDPLCASKDIPILTQAFHEYCRSQDWRVIYVTASEGFTKWARRHVCGALMEVGEELFLDPFSNPKAGSKGRALRNKVNNSQRVGITVHEYVGFDKTLENEIEQVGVAWLKAKKGPQIYLAEVEPFSDRIGKRWFYARLGQETIGVLLLQQMEARKGWLIQFLMTKPDAPVGTSEQLVMSAIAQLRNEDCHLLSFGLALAGELGEIVGLNKLSICLARFGVKAAKKIFHLDRKRRYWRKFQPKKESHYVLFSEHKIGVRDARCIMRALNVNI